MSELKQGAKKESFGTLKNTTWIFTVIGSIIGLLIWTCFLAVVSVCERLWRIENVRHIDKKQFWENVIKCLMEFHGMPYERAHSLAYNHPKSPMIYRLEPFKVANEIARFEVELSLADYKERYLKQIMGQQ